MNIFLNTQLFNFGEVVYPPGGRLGPRTQGDVVMVIVHSGEVNIGVDDRTYRVGPTEATILLPGRQEMFLFADKTETHHTWCEVSEPFLSHEALHLLEQLPSTLAWTSRLEKIFRLGLETKRINSRKLPPVVEHLGHALFHEFFAEAGIVSDSGKPRHPSVEKAFRFIESNLSETISSNEIARSAGTSYQHLARLFRADLGTSPTRELWRIRCERGGDLLRSTGLTVGEIAGLLGFQNPYHFSRCIKKQFGLSPIQIRKADWS